MGLSYVRGERALFGLVILGRHVVLRFSTSHVVTLVGEERFGGRR
jgi:hypothetical protein